MRFTRRLLDRGVARAAIALASLAASFAAASCSSSEDGGGGDGPIDAAVDALEAAVDSGFDAAADAGPVDAAPLPIVCAGSPCATMLVTTLGRAPGDRVEGFCARLMDGTVACWGSNAAGQLGRGDEAGAADSADPARVVGLTDIVDLDHTCALDKSGAAWCWGAGPFLREGLGKVTTERTPVKLPLGPATKIGIGTTVGCAATAEGLQCWGSNNSAQLAPLTTLPPGFATYPPQVIALPSGGKIRQIAVGSATLVVRDDGTTITWGSNPGVGRVSPFFPDPYPTTLGVSGITTLDEVFDNICATAGGTGYCWGASVPKPSGEITSGPDVGRALPEPVVVPEPVVQISTTRSAVVYDVGTAIVQPYRWCATTISGAVYCAGFNESGQAGSGDKDYAYDPVRVVGLPERAAQVRTTHTATCALLTNGKVFCWGNNFYGQLGNGKAKGGSLVPEEVVLP